METGEDCGYLVRGDAMGRWMEAVFARDMRLEQSLAALREVIGSGVVAPPRHILFDVSRVGTEDSRGQMMIFAQRAHETGLDLTDRFAVIVSPGSTAHDFIEPLMHDHGYQFFRLFRSRESAERWLSGAEDEKRSGSGGR